MQEPNFEDATLSIFWSKMAGIYTAIPCIIVRVNEDGIRQSIDVQPVINRKLKNGEVKEHPTILSVPLIYPASKTSAFTFPVNVGDTVLCIFSQRGLDVFKSLDGLPAAGTDYRKFDIRDAIAIPGLFPFSKAINNPAAHTWEHSPFDTVVVHNLGTGREVEVRLKENGDLNISTLQNVTVNANTVTVNASVSANITTPTFNVTADNALFNIGNTIWNGNISQVGNYTQSGIYILSGITMNTHVHSGVQPGTGVSGPPLV